jgi:hypothetical protein
MAEMAGRKELALGHHRAFRTKNRRKWLLNREETERKMALLKRKEGQAQTFQGTRKKNQGTLAGILARVPQGYI